jgi:hypothetical protein
VRRPRADRVRRQLGSDRTRFHPASRPGHRSPSASAARPREPSVPSISRSLRSSRSRSRRLSDRARSGSTSPPVRREEPISCRSR